jgi:sulfur-carrier protein
MKVLYFARVRQIVGHPEEQIEPPEEVRTVSDLLRWLSARSDAHAAAFADPRGIRAAVDQTHVGFDAPVRGAREVAFFPPVTGG